MVTCKSESNLNVPKNLLGFRRAERQNFHKNKRGHTNTSLFNYFFMLQVEPKIRILFVFKRMLKTVFRKNPCDFFRLKEPKNEGNDILYILNLKQPLKPFLHTIHKN